MTATDDDIAKLEETVCPFCDAVVSEPCCSLDEWQLCPVGEVQTPIDRVSYFNNLIDEGIYDVS